MTRKHKILTAALLLLSFITLTIGTPTILNAEQAEPAFFCTVVGVTIIFITAIEIRQDRFIKGITLIGFGVLFPTAYPDFLRIITQTDKLPTDYAQQFEILSQVLLLACSGAGGSIIANYADTNTSEHHNQKMTQPATVDNTEKIDQLIFHTNKLNIFNKKLNKKINFTIAIFAVTTTLAFSYLLLGILK